MTPEALTENRKQVREEYTADSPWRLLRDPTGDNDPNYFAIFGGTGSFDDENPQGFHLTGFLPEADALKIAAAKELYSALRSLVRAYEGNSFGTLYEMQRAMPYARDAIAKAEGRLT